MNVYQRIAEVMKEIQHLSKDGKISFGTTNYKAISEEKVTTVVRESLIRNGLVIVPVGQDHKREGNLTTVDVNYRVQNIEDKEDFIEVTSSGTGADTQDKGVGKAMTYAYKYMLLRTFAIPTGEDPDKISSAEITNKEILAKARAEGKTPGTPDKKPIKTVFPGKQRSNDPKPEPMSKIVLSCMNCGKEVTEGIAKFSKDKFKKILCMDCQKKPEEIKEAEERQEEQQEADIGDRPYQY